MTCQFGQSGSRGVGNQDFWRQNGTMPDTAPPPAFDPALLASYRFWTDDLVRWGDLDSVGHVNNAIFARYFESGRIAYLAAAGARLGDTAGEFMLVRLAIDFHAQMHYPGAVRIGTRLARLGRSSASFAQAIFQDRQCAASGEAVVVLVDRASNRSTVMPATMRQALSQLSD
jgi:acyl-CoA thioester hydrolase